MTKATTRPDESVLGPGMERGLRLWRRQFREWWRARHDDVVVVSYPKAGRTWHRVALAQYLRLLTHQTDSRSIDTRKLVRNTELSRVSYSHNGANFLYAIPPDHPLNASTPLWRNQSIILLIRDPRDILVSSYLHARFRSDSFRGTISEFIRHPYTGIEKILTAFNRWNTNRDVASRFIVQRYEDMHQNLGDVLRHTLSFSGIEVKDDLVNEAVRFSHIDNMRKLESNGYFESGAMRTASNDGATDGRKVRAGKVGGYSEHLSPSDLQYIEETTSRLGNPFV